MENLSYLCTRKSDSTSLKIYRGMEQLAARRAHNPKVGGSSPPPATKGAKQQCLAPNFMLCKVVKCFIISE